MHACTSAMDFSLSSWLSLREWNNLITTAVNLAIEQSLLTEAWVKVKHVLITEELVK